MTSRFAGTCYGCQKPIAKGETIHYAGPGQAYHPTCAKAKADQAGPDRFDMDYEDRCAEACGL